MKQFYFYEHYARPICKLTHKETGQLTKAICGYMFNDKEPSEKTTPKARALLDFIKGNADVCSLSMYGIVERFRQLKGI